MPIKNLSDEVRMPRLGKIHLGIRVKKIRQSDGKEIEYPEKTDYFVLPKEHSDYKKLVEIYGEQPKELRILIPVEDEELWASQYYRAYDMSRGLICKGDGEMALRMIDIATGALSTKETKTVTMKEIICEGKNCPDYKAKKCGETMNLRFLLPEVPGLGIWQIDTGSINSIININSCATIIKKAFGRISLVPLLLTLESIEVNNPESGKKQRVYVLNLRTSITLAQLADAAREQSKILSLTPGDFEEAWKEEVAKDTDDLFGEAPPSNPPQETRTETRVEPAPPVNSQPEPEKAVKPSGKDKLFIEVREHMPHLVKDKDVVNWLKAGPNGFTEDYINNNPDKVLEELKKTQKW